SAQIPIAQSHTNPPELAVRLDVLRLVCECVILRAYSLGLFDFGVQVVAVVEELASGLVHEDAEVDVAREGIIIADLGICRHLGGGTPETGSMRLIEASRQAGVNDKE